MGPYAFFQASLAGYFVFSTLSCFILWSRTRKDWRLLVLGLVCLAGSIQAVGIVGIATAETVADAQRALDVRTVAATFTIIGFMWLYSHLGGLRAPVFVWAVTVDMLFVSGLILFGVDILGAVTAVVPSPLPWGESYSFTERTSPDVGVVLLAYVGVLGSLVFCLLASARLWHRDRTSGVLLTTAAIVLVISAASGFLVDYLRLRLPYLGGVGLGVGVMLLAVQFARTNQQRDLQLATTERRYRAIFDQTFQFIGLLDVRGRLLEANQTALEFAGVRPPDVIGKAFWDTPWWTHSAELQQRLREAVHDASRGNVQRFEVTHLDREGQLRYVDFSLKPVRDAEGKVILLIPEGRDITERVAADEEKRKLEQKLLQAQKMEALGQLAGGVAHDFNNLLTVIAGHTDMLLSDRADTPARHDLEQIRQAAERAASMTRQLLAFGRKSILEPKVLNLNTVVSETETMLRRTIGENIQLEVKKAPDLQWVKADPDQLGRALLNMAINARDAMPDGGVLVIETHNVMVPAETSGTRVVPHVMLAMSDSGSGMSPETKSRLFEPFFTTKGQGKGTGLGLAVVDGIVKQSGGRVEVSSEVGVGTTFKIYLPATDRQDVVKPHSPDGRPPRGTETVLLVEDEPAVREMTRTALQRHGYTVLPAASGTEALAIARANGLINVVLTDVVMPGMSGPQLVEQLRAERPALAALFMSGYTSDAVLRHGIETGETDFLQKPFSAGALAAKLRQVLDRG